MPVSFAKDIRPLFRDDPDVAAMNDFGLDLSSYADVKAKAASIHATLKEGATPATEPGLMTALASARSGWKKGWPAAEACLDANRGCC